MKINITSKLFFGKYGYKIRFQLPKDLEQRKKTVNDIKKEFQTRNIKYITRRSEVWNQTKGNVFAIPVVIFYYNNKDLFDVVKDRYNILEYSYIVNSRHFEVLNENHRIVVRSSLFLKQYKYAIRLRRDLPGKEIRAALKGFSKKDYFLSMGQACFENGFSSIYTNNTNLLLKIKLVFSDSLVNIGEVMLVDELTDKAA